MPNERLENYHRQIDEAQRRNWLAMERARALREPYVPNPRDTPPEGTTINSRPAASSNPDFFMTTGRSTGRTMWINQEAYANYRRFQELRERAYSQWLMTGRVDMPSIGDGIASQISDTNETNETNENMFRVGDVVRVKRAYYGRYSITNGNMYSAVVDRRTLSGAVRITITEHRISSEVGEQHDLDPEHLALVTRVDWRVGDQVRVHPVDEESSAEGNRRLRRTDSSEIAVIRDIDTSETRPIYVQWASDDYVASYVAGELFPVGMSYEPRPVELAPVDNSTGQVRGSFPWETMTTFNAASSSGEEATSPRRIVKTMMDTYIPAVSPTVLTDEIGTFYYIDKDNISIYSLDRLKLPKLVKVVLVARAPGVGHVSIVNGERYGFREGYLGTIGGRIPHSTGFASNANYLIQADLVEGDPAYAKMAKVPKPKATSEQLTPGSWAKCSNNKGYDNLTKGKKYQVLDVSTSQYNASRSLIQIEDDNGRSIEVLSNKFKPSDAPIEVPQTTTA